jgi:hypothetical protein
MARAVNKGLGAKAHALSSGADSHKEEKKVVRRGPCLAMQHFELLQCMECYSTWETQRGPEYLPVPTSKSLAPPLNALSGRVVLSRSDSVGTNFLVATLLRFGRSGAGAGSALNEALSRGLLTSEREMGCFPLIVVF